MCPKPSEHSFMSYDYELAENLAQHSERRKKIQSRKQNVNQSYRETDNRNATQWNKMKGQSADGKYTYVSEPNKWRTKIVQSMLLSHKERMYIVWGRVNMQVSPWKC